MVFSGLRIPRCWAMVGNCFWQKESCPHPGVRPWGRGVLGQKGGQTLGPRSAVRHRTRLATPSPPHIWHGTAHPRPSPHRHLPIRRRWDLHPTLPSMPPAPWRALSGPGGWSWGSCSVLRFICCLLPPAIPGSFADPQSTDTLVEAELNLPRDPARPQNLPWPQQRLKHLPARRRPLGDAALGLDENSRFGGEGEL